MSFLIGLIPAPYRLLVGVIAALVALAAAAGAGWTARGWKEDAARLEAERAQAKFNKETLEGWAAAVQKITADREADRQQAANERRQWQKEIDDAKRRGPLVLCGAGLRDDVAPRPGGAGARLSGDFVRLWNGAFGIGLPAALGPWRADGAGAEADPAGVAPEDALENIAANGEQCNDLRGRLLAWQAWARSIGAAK